MLDGIPRALPALLEAAKLGARAHKSGFDWPDCEGIFAKLEEETQELRQAIDAPVPVHENVVSEIGDMLFTVVNLARQLNIEPEFALRHTNAKFRRRFAAMEAASPQPLEALSAAANAKNVAGASATLSEMKATCKACHSKFK